MSGARSFSRLKTSFWTDSKMLRLSDRARLLAAYLITGPHASALGCFKLPDGYICEDLKWDRETVTQTLSELFRNGFANRCQDTSFVLVTNYLRHNPPENPNQGKLIARLAEDIPDDFSYGAELLATLEPFGKRLPEGFTKRLRQRFAKGLGERFGKHHYHYQYQDQEIPSCSSRDSVPRDDAAEPAHAAAASQPVEGSARPYGVPRLDEADDDEPAELPPERLIVQALDGAIVAHYGQRQARPYPHQSDREVAERLAAHGVSVQTCRDVIEAKVAARRAKGRDKPRSLALFEDDIRAAHDASKAKRPNGSAAPAAQAEADPGNPDDNAVWQEDACRKHLEGWDWSRIREWFAPPIERAKRAGAGDILGDHPPGHPDCRVPAWIVERVCGESVAERQGNYTTDAERQPVANWHQMGGK